MGKVESYPDLEAWKQSKNLVQHIYELTTCFPNEEQFGLTNQLRRAAVSVPFNIAEDCGRNHYRDSIQRYFIARGSLYEVETQILIAGDLWYITKNALESVLVNIKSCKKLLNGFINYYESKNPDTFSHVSEGIEDYKPANEQLPTKN
jgi:four helix bundle protein